MSLLACCVVLVAVPLAQQPPPARPQPDPRQPAAKAPPMPVPLSVVCRRGARELTIDGSLVDWPELPALALDDKRQLSGTAYGAWRDGSDLSAFAFMLWDEDALYFAANVRDEWHRELDATTLMTSEIPVADSIVLSFDPARNTRALGPDPGRSDDVEFWLGNEAAHELLCWDRLRGSARVLSKGRQVVSHDKERGVTSYEARIPWDEILPLGQKARVGGVFDLQVVVNDFDESTDPMPQTRIGWTFGCGELIDPGLFGTVMLIADEGRFTGPMPEFPPKGLGPVASDAEQWADLARRLRANPPVVHDGSTAPEECGGIARLTALEQLESHINRYPRVDYVEYCQRVHRHMWREVAGIAAHGLPSFWLRELDAMSLRAEAAVPNATVRLFRVPQGGWLLRAPTNNCLVDAAGAGLESRLWGGAQFVVLTQPLDMTRRNDELLVQMATAKVKRPFLTHIAFHLPRLPMTEMPLVEPGQTMEQPGGVRVQALGGKRADGSVPMALAYRIEFPAGPSLLFAGPSIHPDQLAAQPCDALILTPWNDHSVEIAQKLRPRLVVIDDVFLCASAPNLPRVGLRHAHLLQKAVLPIPSILLAPGDSWDVVRAQ